jgi:hypothetical protein
MITIKTLTKKKMYSKRKNTTKILKKRKLVNEKEYDWLKENGYEDIEPLDYDGEYKKMIKETLIPLYNDYIKKHGLYFIKKDFIKECEEFCGHVTSRMKVIHVDKCAKFLRLMTLFQVESEEYRKLKKKFYINCYPLINIGDISLRLKELNHEWEQKKKFFNYCMGYKVQRLAALFHCFSDHNDTLRDKFLFFENKRNNIVKKLTDTFIEKEINDFDFDRINEYWDNISKKEMEQLGNLENITLAEWKDVEDCINNYYK